MVLFGKTIDSSLKSNTEKLRPPIVVLDKFAKMRHKTGKIDYIIPNAHFEILTYLVPLSFLGFVQLTNFNHAIEIIFNPDIP